MNLSLWVISEGLSESPSELVCTKDDLNIRTFRMFEPEGQNEEPDILYIGTSEMFFYDGQEQVVLKNEENYIRLDSTDMIRAVNMIHTLFQYYNEWEERCKNIIRSGKELRLLLDLGEELLRAPVFLINASQYLITYSSGVEKMADKREIRDFIRNNSMPDKVLEEFNRKYPESFQHQDIFFLAKGLFPTDSWIHQIFFRGEQIATLNLMRPIAERPAGSCQLFRLFAEYVRMWIDSNHINDNSYLFSSDFSRLLEGDMQPGDAFEQRMLLKGWTPDCRKQIIVTEAAYEWFHFDAHLAQRFSARLPSVLAVPFQKQIVILCNLDTAEPEQFEKALLEEIRLNKYYGASSFAFIGIEGIPEAYRQADYLLRQNKPVSGMIYKGSMDAMRYISWIADQNSRLMILHPLPAMIGEYDSTNRTSFFETLFCYLRNERNHRLTAEELNIHRNTLAFRLEKIRELWNPDLDDNTERFYLLYTFYHDAYHGRKQ